MPSLRPGAAFWAGAFHAESESTFRVRNPATGAVLQVLPSFGAEHAEQAVDAAAACLATPPTLEQRRSWLTGIAQALGEHRERLAALITSENGKPLVEARGEVDYAAGFYREAVRHLTRLEPQELSEHPRGHRWTVHHRSAGVVALITPWNFPQAMLAKKLAGAIAAGCPSVIKPSELTPMSAIALMVLVDGLDMPPGFVNLVFGDAPAIGRVFCQRPEVRVLSFTGSTPVGRLLAAQCAPTLKRLSMELGGNAPLLVFEDADLDQAVAALMANKFRCAGQTCVCTNRVLVAAPVYEDFVERVGHAVSALRVGPGTEDVDLGPLINAASWRKVAEHVQDAVALGARLQLGGPSVSQAPFFAPTVLTGVDSTMRCVREETFGPVVAIRSFSDEEEGLTLANDTPYGLAAYVFSQDPARLQRAAARLHFGHVGLNTTAGPTPEAPFGGMGASGVGREGGFEGVLEFIELQTCPEPT